MDKINLQQAINYEEKTQELLATVQSVELYSDQADENVEVMLQNDKGESKFAGIGVTKLETVNNSEVDDGLESPKKSYQSSQKQSKKKFKTDERVKQSASLQKTSTQNGDLYDPQVHDGDLSVVISLGTTQENNKSAFASPVYFKEKGSPQNDFSLTNKPLQHLKLTTQFDKEGNNEDVIVEQNVMAESEEMAASSAGNEEDANEDLLEKEVVSSLSSQGDYTPSIHKKYQEQGKSTHHKFANSSSNFHQYALGSIASDRRMSQAPAPLPLYTGEIRGREYSNIEEQKRGQSRMLSARQTQMEEAVNERRLEEQRRLQISLEQKTASSKMYSKRSKRRQKSQNSEKVKVNSDLIKSDTAVIFKQDSDDTDGSAAEIKSQKDCKHLRVRLGKCRSCKFQVPQYGSVFDTGTVQTFIKVVFVDESKKKATATTNQSATSQFNHDLQQMTIIQENAAEIAITDQQKTQGRNDQSISVAPPRYDGLPPRESYMRDIRPTIRESSMIIMTTIFESYNPQNTHLMREYMLHVIIKNVRRMYKHKLISLSTFRKFSVLKVGPPPNQSQELRQFLSQLKRNNKTQDPEHLQIDSTIESGNLERAEAQPMSQDYIMLQRSRKQQIIQKYNLYCKVDTNTKGHQQWFYFRLKNTKKDVKYQFSICNFTKPFSLFKQGMQVQMLSKKHQQAHLKALEEEIAVFKALDPEEQAQGKQNLSNAAQLYMTTGLVKEQWQLTGTKIEYTKSKLERGGWNIPGPTNLDDEEEPNVDQDDIILQTDTLLQGESSQANYTQPEVSGQQYFRKRYFYQMNFEIDFEYEDDTVYLAYSQPYQYSQIIAHMFAVEQKISKLPGGKDKNDVKKGFKRKITRNAVVYERSLHCTTICGLPVPKISITTNKSELAKQTMFGRRKIIFVTARVHPGETNASTVFEGFLDQLVDQVEYSPVLANFIVQLVPCMNPDGVVCGNYRSSLAGVDLNRQWILPSKELHPEVYHTKALMNKITNVENKKILIYCDIHCHSKKKNSFLYGCNTAAEGAAFSTWTQVRLLPRLLARRSQYISLPSCRFVIDACKLGTARVVVWKEFQVMNSFTLENSFYGYDYGPETRVYTQTNYREIGASFEKTLNDYRLCLAQIYQEMITSKGWLKPIKLKEITGIPAAEVIANSLKEDKLRKKKEKFIREYHNKMAANNQINAQSQKGHSFAPNTAQSGSNSMVQQNVSASQQQQRRLSKDANVLISQNSMVEMGSISGAGKVQVTKNISNSASIKASLLADTKPQESIKQDPYNAFINENLHGSQQSNLNLNGKAILIDNEQNPVVDTSKFKQQKKREVVIISNDYPGLAFKNKESTYTLLAEEAAFAAKRVSSGGHILSSSNGDEELVQKVQKKFGHSTTMDLLDDNYEDINVKGPEDQEDQQQQSEPISDSDIYGGYENMAPWGDAAGIYNQGASGVDNVEDQSQSNNEREEASNHEKVGNWRQLFDQEELNRAYQSSIVADEISTAQEQLLQKPVAADQDKIRGQKNDTLLADQSSQLHKIEENNAPQDENDDSGDSASGDNLEDQDLYSQVYMQKQYSIEQQMRQTTRAQNNFIQEVKIMIKKKKQVMDRTPSPDSNELRDSMQQQSQRQIWPSIYDYKNQSTEGLQLQGTQIKKEESKFQQMLGKEVLRKPLRHYINNVQQDMLLKIGKSKQGGGVPQQKELQDMLQASRIDLESGKTKALSKFQKQQALNAIQLAYPQNTSNERKSLIDLIQKNSMYKEGVGPEEQLGGILTSNKLQMNAVPSQKKQATQAQNPQSHHKAQRALQAESASKSTRQQKYQQHQQSLPKKVQYQGSVIHASQINTTSVVEQQSSVRGTIQSKKRKNSKEYFMQVKASASPNDPTQSSMIGLKIEHFQSKTKQQQSTDSIRGEEVLKNQGSINIKNTPIKIEIQRQDKEKQQSTTVSVNNFKLQTPGNPGQEDIGYSQQIGGAKTNKFNLLNNPQNEAKKLQKLGRKLGKGGSVSLASQNDIEQQKAELSQQQSRVFRAKISSRKSSVKVGQGEAAKDQNTLSAKVITAGVSKKESHRNNKQSESGRILENMIAVASAPLTSTTPERRHKQINNSDYEQISDQFSKQFASIGEKKQQIQRKLFNYKKNNVNSRRGDNNKTDNKTQAERQSKKPQNSRKKSDKDFNYFQVQVVSDAGHRAASPNQTEQRGDDSVLENRNNIKLSQLGQNLNESQQQSEEKFQTIQQSSVYKQNSDYQNSNEKKQLGRGNTGYKTDSGLGCETDGVSYTMDSMLKHDINGVDIHGVTLTREQQFRSTTPSRGIDLKDYAKIQSDYVVQQQKQSNQSPFKASITPLKGDTQIGRVEIKARESAAVKQQPSLKQHPLQRRLVGKNDTALEFEQESSKIVPTTGSISKDVQGRIVQELDRATAHINIEENRSLQTRQLSPFSQNEILGKQKSLFSQKIENQREVRKISISGPNTNDPTKAAAANKGKRQRQEQEAYINNSSSNNQSLESFPHQQMQQQSEKVQSGNQLSRGRSEQFQQYIQKNMHKVNNQEQKDVYERQIQVSLKKRHLIPVSSKESINFSGKKSMRTVPSENPIKIEHNHASKEQRGVFNVYSGSPQQKLSAAQQLKKIKFNHHQLKSQHTLIQNSSSPDPRPQGGVLAQNLSNQIKGMNLIHSHNTSSRKPSQVLNYQGQKQNKPYAAYNQDNQQQQQKQLLLDFGKDHNSSAAAHHLLSVKKSVNENGSKVNSMEKISTHNVASFDRLSSNDHKNSKQQQQLLLDGGLSQYQGESRQSMAVFSNANNSLPKIAARTTEDSRNQHIKQKKSLSIRQIQSNGIVDSSQTLQSYHNNHEVQYDQDLVTRSLANVNVFQAAQAMDTNGINSNSSIQSSPARSMIMMPGSLFNKNTMVTNSMQIGGTQQQPPNFARLPIEQNSNTQNRIKIKQMLNKGADQNWKYEQSTLDKNKTRLNSGGNAALTIEDKLPLLPLADKAVKKNYTGLDNEIYNFQARSGNHMTKVPSQKLNLRQSQENSPVTINHRALQNFRRQSQL